MRWRFSYVILCGVKTYFCPVWLDSIRTPLTPPLCCRELFSLENKHGFFRGRKKLTNILDLSFHEVLENFHI